MLINPAQKMPSIQRRISIEFRNPAHQLSANILGSYLWRYMYLSSVSRLIHDGSTREELFEYIMHRFLKVYVKYTAFDAQIYFKTGVCYNCPPFAVCILCLV